MDVFLITQLNNLPETLLQRCLAQVPKSRQEKVLRLRTDNRKRQSLLAYMLLVYALYQHDGVLQLPELPAEGKPEIKGREDLYCSISHCSLAAAAVVYHAPIGVDIERIRMYNPKIAGYVCSAEEIQNIENAEDPNLAFTELWTKKESCIKLYGGSVGPNMKYIGERFKDLNFETKIGDGWVMTACWKKE